MLELLDGTNPQVHKFIHELLEKWDPPEKGSQRILEVLMKKNVIYISVLHELC